MTFATKLNATPPKAHIEMHSSAFVHLTPTLPSPPRRRPRRHQLRCSVLPTASATPLSLGPFKSVTPVGLGTWAWGNRFLFNYSTSDDALLQEAFETAITRGVNLIDTADSYGTGNLNARAEILLGKFLSSSPVPTSDVIIATKFASYPWRITPQSIASAAARSAERLGRPVDLGQIHWSTSKYAPWQERALWDGLALAHERGDVREIGVSNFGPKQLVRIERYLREERGIQLATAQTQLSLLARTPTEDGFLDTAKRLGVGVIGYSPLCLGLLTGKYSDNVPSGPRGFLFRSLLKGSDALIAKLREIGDRKGGKLPGQVAIAWCLAQGVVVITGVREPRHVEESVSACDITLSRDECEELEAVARAGPQMIQNSFQTA